MNKNLVPDLSSRELQAVCAIADEGSFLAASIALDLSQPALTRTVQRVEAAIGVELFRRSTRKVEITPAGQEFVALANRILADLRISFEGMREIADEQRGQVIISAVMSVAYTHLPTVVASYRESRPRIEIRSGRAFTARYWTTSAAVSPTWGSPMSTISPASFPALHWVVRDSTWSCPRATPSLAARR